MPAVMEQDTKSLADEYQCDKCKVSRSIYTNSSACKGCDGTSHFEPIEESK